MTNTARNDLDSTATTEFVSAFPPRRRSHRHRPLPRAVRAARSWTDLMELPEDSPERNAAIDAHFEEFLGLKPGGGNCRLRVVE
jgi:hypothetical protein